MIFLSFVSGQHYGKMPSLLSDITDELELGKKRNILVCGINPDDFGNCLYAFSQINEEMRACRNDKIIVMNVEHRIEKNALIRNTKHFNLLARPGRYVLWSKALFRQLQKESGTPAALSHLGVYDPGKDALLYTSPIKRISDLKPIRKYLDYK